MSRLSPQIKATLGLTLALSLAACQSASTSDSFAAKWVRPVVKQLKPLSADYALDRDAQDFAAQTGAITNAAECFPMHIRDAGRIGILYLFCSDTAKQRDGEGVQISENFSVPESIARRYNFWRRVYSLWGKDQYVMHLSHYPEVVIEAYDVSRVGEAIGPMAREIMVKKAAKDQRNLYRKMFWTMHANRNHEERFTPAMKRMAATMAHIKDADKYATAAQTLRLQRGQRDFIATGLAVAPKYLHAIEEEFRAQNIPVEISRLAFVESSFNLKARSKVGASGVYQIMPATGRQYLKMHSGVDERNDPIKASRAAAKLLRLNYKLTGAWPLAITAYNHGVGGIRRAVNSVHSKDIAVLINRYRGNAFGFASMNFYASFLGVLATVKDADRLFPEVPKVMPLAFANVRLNKPTSLAALKKQYTMSSSDVAEYNPDIGFNTIRVHGILPTGYVLKVPARTESSYINTSIKPAS